MAVDLRQQAFRFGVDELTESTHGWYAAESTNPTAGSIPLDSPFLLRFCLKEYGTSIFPNVAPQFQYSKNGGAWTNITTSSAVVKAVAVTPLTPGAHCTKRLVGGSTPFTNLNAGQTESGSSGGASNDILGGGSSETECGLQIIAADVSDGDVLQFRVDQFGLTYISIPSYTIDTQRRAEVSWAEMEVPTAPSRAMVSWAEIEVPVATDRKCKVSWAEMEVPDNTSRRSRVSWAELEVPAVSTRRAIVSWAELEVAEADILRSALKPGSIPRVRK